jgi:hypothetical protein
MQRMHVFFRQGLVLTAAALAFSSCRAAEDTSPAVGSMTVTMQRTRLPLGSPVEMTYRFTIAPDAPSIGSRRVFVHFLDQDDELMWTDDHDPPTPTTQWTAGRTIEYTRTMFVLIFKDGWHGAEVAPQNKDEEWQWTKKEATLAFRNPRRDAMLFLQVDNPIAQTGGARQVEVRLGDQVLATVPVSATELPVHKVPLSTSALGRGDMVELRLVPDRTFVPALEPGSSSGDTRELGVRVFHAYVLPS